MCATNFFCNTISCKDCNAKNSFLETVNCQTVTLAIDIGFALMMSEMYDYLSIHNIRK